MRPKTVGTPSLLAAFGGAECFAQKSRKPRNRDSYRCALRAILAPSVRLKRHCSMASAHWLNPAEHFL
jgi:hypothetical protein